MGLLKIRYLAKYVDDYNVYWMFTIFYYLDVLWIIYTCNCIDWFLFWKSGD